MGRKRRRGRQRAPAQGGGEPECDEWDRPQCLEGGNDGGAERVAWSAIGSHSAFLVFDLNGDGRILNLSEMLGVSVAGSRHGRPGSDNNILRWQREESHA
jgi:hypothetical protein